MGAGLVIAVAAGWGLIQLFGDDGDAASTGAPVSVEQTPEVLNPDPVPESVPVTEADEGAGGAVMDMSADTALAGEAAGAEASPSPTDTFDPIDAGTLEQLSDGVLESISSFYGRVGAFDNEQIGCAELQSSFVEVMDSWIEYNTRGKAGWQGRLPAELEARDERLYRGVQDVERLFEGTSCPRP
jgi:hypothetical protein